MFDPADFKEEAKSFEVSSYRLPEVGLQEYAREATRLRCRFELHAKRIESEDHDIARLHEPVL